MNGLTLFEFDEVDFEGDLFFAERKDESFFPDEIFVIGRWLAISFCFVVSEATKHGSIFAGILKLGFPECDY